MRFGAVVLRARRAAAARARACRRRAGCPAHHPSGVPGRGRRRGGPRRSARRSPHDRWYWAVGHRLVDLRQHRLARRDARPGLPPGPGHRHRHRRRLRARPAAARRARTLGGPRRRLRLRHLLQRARVLQLDDLLRDGHGRHALRPARRAAPRAAGAAAGGDRRRRARRRPRGAAGAARHHPRGHRRLDPPRAARRTGVHRAGRPHLAGGPGADLAARARHSTRARPGPRLGRAAGPPASPLRARRARARQVLALLDACAREVRGLAEVAAHPQAGPRRAAGGRLPPRRGRRTPPGRNRRRHPDAAAHATGPPTSAPAPAARPRPPAHRTRPRPSARPRDRPDLPRRPLAAAPRTALAA